jgi:hypothetical protein
VRTQHLHGGGGAQVARNARTVVPV